MRNLSRNSRKNKRKNINKSQKKQSMQNSKNSQIPTVFTNNELGIKLQKLWLQENHELLIKSMQEAQSEFVVVTPQKQGDSVIAKVDFCNLDEFQDKKFQPFQKQLDSMFSYFEKMKGDDKLIVFFVNSQNRLSCYTCNSGDPNNLTLSKKDYYEVNGDDLKINFHLLKTQFGLNDYDVNFLGKIHFEAKNGAHLALDGTLRVLEPLLFGLLKYVSSYSALIEKAKLDNEFDKLLILETDMDGRIYVISTLILKQNILHAKSIFKKINEKTFGEFFKEGNSSRKAS
jgi:hypothetical protein